MSLREVIINATNGRQDATFAFDDSSSSGSNVQQMICAGMQDQGMIPGTTGYMIFTDQRPIILYGQVAPYYPNGWRLPILAMYDALNNVRLWQTGFDGVDHLVTISGLANGLPKISKRRVDLNSTGKDHNGQASLEANSRHLKKTRNKGYGPYGVELNHTAEPMLCNDYKPYTTVIRTPVGLSPKMDGIRVVIKPQQDGTFAYTSRHNKQFTQLDHVVEEISNFHRYLPPGSVLDSEAYNHTELLTKTKLAMVKKGLPNGGKNKGKGSAANERFEDISGIMRTTTFKHPLAPKLQLWIHDVDYQPRVPFEVRHQVLTDAFAAYKRDGGTNFTFCIVPNHLLYTHEQIMQYYDYYIEQGYEGIVMRHTSSGAPPGSDLYNLSLYRNGRSNNCLKFKAFKEAEGLIIGIEVAKGDQEGAAIFVVQLQNGLVFKLQMADTSIDQRRWWAQNPQEVMYKLVTYRYQDECGSGKPRIATGKVVHFNTPVDLSKYAVFHTIRDYEVPGDVRGQQLFQYYPQ